jgi:SAM-dependent methyltransferase
MSVTTHDGDELARVYRTRFEGQKEYRLAVWRILIGAVFARWLPADGQILDLGAGHGEFINQVEAPDRLAMDLNPDTRHSLRPEVRFLEQDCSAPWPIEEGSLGLVFTSNFFEHLPDKATLQRTLERAYRALRPSGRLVAVGPNIRLVQGAYWDFWDHHLPLTEKSLAELGRLTGFVVEHEWGTTLPYSMSQGFAPPLWGVRLYARLPFLWRFFGKQFIVVLRKP